MTFLNIGKNDKLNICVKTCVILITLQAKTIAGLMNLKKQSSNERAQHKTLPKPSKEIYRPPIPFIKNVNLQGFLLLKLGM